MSGAGETPVESHRATDSAPCELAHWIGGRPVRGGEPGVDVLDPATGAVVARAPLAVASEVDAAVDAAAAVQRGWGETSLARRAVVLFAFRELVNTNREELAATISREHGKVLGDARGEVARGLDAIEFACGIPHLLRGGATAQASTGIDLRDVRQPLGVVAGITPFNFPLMVPMWMHPLAIAAGNAFILKPSEQDPSVSMRVAELWRQAGLPDGLFNVLHGDADAAAALVDHRGVAAVSFVGSTPVARRVHEVGRITGKRVQALGGAKNHLVVLPDADLEQAADAAASAAYGSAGQRCMAVSVVVAVGEAATPLVAEIAARARAIRVGPWTDPEAEMGPVVSAAARDRIVRAIEGAVVAGADLVVDGRMSAAPADGGGFWVGPTLFDRVEPEQAIYAEEIFGPVLVVVRVAGFDAALELIRANPYGNGASIFTADGGAAREFESAVPAGAIGVNVPIPIPVSYHSFGGWKDSMFGEQGVYGDAGVSFYTRLKVITSRWPDSARRGVDLGFPASE